MSLPTSDQQSHRLKGNARVLQIANHAHPHHHTPMLIAGIDPGLNTTGYAVLDVAGPTPVIKDAGICTTKASIPLPQRLHALDTDIAAILDQWHPARLGVEKLYAHYNHPRTAVQMGHARGVILAAAARRDIPVVDLPATAIKKHLTGNGRATKEQMQNAILQTFSLPQVPEPNDVADAIAIAYCCAQATMV